jgi:hypothetical protein
MEEIEDKEEQKREREKKKNKRIYLDLSLFQKKIFLGGQIFFFLKS